MRGNEGSTAISPPATRFQTASELAEAYGVNRRNCAGSAATTRSVRPLVETAASEIGSACVTPVVCSTRLRMASEIGLVLLSRMSGVRSGICSFPGASTAYSVPDVAADPAPDEPGVDPAPPDVALPERSAEVGVSDS